MVATSSDQTITSCHVIRTVCTARARARADRPFRRSNTGHALIRVRCSIKVPLSPKF